MSKPPQASSYRWLVLGIVIMGTFMAILDSSIVNVALPHMMSAFGVGRDQIEWVSTAFMIATAVAMPLVGWLVGRIGLKTLYLVSLALFTFGSAVCAFSWSFDSLVVARIIQAVGGGAIQPVGMAMVADLFEPHERGRALGIWGTGVMVGPAIGPTLGGYLTDWFNWRAIFSVNLPFGVITLIAGLTIIQRRGAAARRRVPLDAWGFFFLSLALISGLLALSYGQEKGWTSDYILTCLALSVVGLILFVAVEGAVVHPLLDLGLFKIRNFTLSLTLAVFRAVGLFGGVFLLPIFLESLVGYTTISTGLWMMPGALTVGVMMPIAGRMTDRLNVRWLAFVGTAVTAVSMFLYAYLDPLSGALTIIGPQIIRGVGLALMMAPLITTALNAVPPQQVATASSFLNVAQRVGGAFGIALLNTYVTNSIHIHAVRMSDRFPLEGTGFVKLLLRVAGKVLYQVHGILPEAKTKAAALAARTFYHRAQVLGFQDGFVLAGWIVLLGLPLCLALKQTRRSARVRRAGAPGRERRGPAPAPTRG